MQDRKNIAFSIFLNLVQSCLRYEKENTNFQFILFHPRYNGLQYKGPSHATIPLNP
jgi:hypothetical protein